MPAADAYASWIGRSEIRGDTITPTPWRALAATLDLASPAAAAGDALPPLAHWLYALPLHPASEIGSDGHARRGAFLPPVALPRRMWAGGRFRFEQPLRIGDAATRTSTIESINAKSGRSGELVFVTVRHDWRRTEAGPIALTEWHDIVYRDALPVEEIAPATSATPAQPNAGVSASIAKTLTANPLPKADWSREIVADPVLLFRYSALTFNAHRIHYDLAYATLAEGYPGLVVHGPLLATLLLGLLQRELPNAELSNFEFRAKRPLFATRPFHVHGASAGGQTTRLWANDFDGELAMEASATLR